MSKNKKEVLTKVSKPNRVGESRSLHKYNQMKKIVRFLMLKKELTEAGFPAQFNSGDEARLAKFKVRMEKQRKLAAPELIMRGRNARRGLNRGGGVGSRLAKLASKRK